MINIIKQEIPIDESLKKKLEFICDFCNTTPIFINGSIRRIDMTNLTYIEPHRKIINNTTFLVLIILMMFISKTLVIKLKSMN